MEKLKRYLIFLIGLFISSLGVSLVTKANLGTSPISSIPYVLSLNFPLTLGNFTIIFSLFLIVLQLLILRRNFKVEHLLQIPISILFGYFIDWTMLLLSFVHPDAYLMKIVYLLLGCIVLGFGVYCEVIADVAMLPGESFVRAVVQTWHREFGSTKVAFDVTMTVLAAVLSFIFAGQLNGVREGTVIAALLVGFIARLFGRWLAFVPALLFPEAKNSAKTTDKEHAVSDHSKNKHGKTVITIGRQYGSGGHDIGKKLAEEFGYSFYDEELIRLTAGTTGYSEEYIEKEEESLTNSLLYDLVSQIHLSEDRETPKDKIFEAESKVLNELADKGNCVIVGRCADQVLKDRKNCLHLFFHAPIESRIQRVMERTDLSEKEAKSSIHKEDRRRADNYHYYTRKIWGSSANYHLSLDTDFGMDFISSLIHDLM